MLLSNETYDRLKFIAIYIIPSIATFVGVVGCSLQWEPTAIATTIIMASAKAIIFFIVFMNYFPFLSFFPF